MKGSLDDYPEVIFRDATYKFLEIRMACFLAIIEDSNGQSEIVAAGLFATEDKETLRWFFSTFKELNKSWASIRITMADKDLTKRVMNELLPQCAQGPKAWHIKTSTRDRS